MTTVTALQGKGWAAIACDSRVTLEARPWMLPKETCKVVKNGPYLIGVTGYLRCIPLIEYSFSPTIPDAFLSVKELDRFMTTVFIPELRDFLKETSLNMKEEEDIFVPSILVLVNGVVYDIDSIFTWSRDPSCIYAEGSGEDYARGSLFSLINGNVADLEIADAKRIMKEAITNTAKLDLHTGGPVHTFVQLSKTKK